MGQIVLSQGRIQTIHKTSDSLGNLCIDETNVDNTQRSYSQISPVYPILYYLPRESMLAIFDSKNEINAIYPTFAKELGFQSLIYLSSSWAMQTSIVTCSTKFASKKKSNARDLQTSFWHYVNNTDIRVIILLCYDYILVPLSLQHASSTS